MDWWLTDDAVTGHGFLHVALRGEDAAWYREYLLVFCFLTPLALERVRWLVEQTAGANGRLGERDAEIRLWVSSWDAPPLEAGNEVVLMPGLEFPVRSRLRTFALQYVMSCLMPLGLPGRVRAGDCGGHDGRGPLMVLLAGGPRIVRFKCPGCRLTVEGEAFPVQVWADGHVFDCVEERLKIHTLDESGRIRTESARPRPRAGGLRIQKRS